MEAQRLGDVVMPTPTRTLRDLLHEALNDLSAGRPQRFVVADLLAALKEMGSSERDAA